MNEKLKSMTLSSPCWANSSSTCQETSRFLLKRKVHSRVHNIPPRVSVASETNPIYFSQTDVFQILSNIILPSTFRYKIENN